MQKSPGSRALWRSGLFSLCAGALISLVLLRFLSQLDQPGLTPEDLRRSGAVMEEKAECMDDRDGDLHTQLSARSHRNGTSAAQRSHDL